MKMSTLGIHNKTVIFADIFSNMSRGLVNSESTESLDARPLELNDSWGSMPHGNEFYHYVFGSCCRRHEEQDDPFNSLSGRFRGQIFLQQRY